MRLKFSKKLRTACLSSKFTGSYKQTKITSKVLNSICQCANFICLISTFYCKPKKIRNRAWPCTGYYPLSFLFINYSNNYSTPSFIFTYLWCAYLCMLMRVFDLAYIVHKTGVTRVATMQIKIAFWSSIFSACLNV